jgi:hypothetical protein
MAGSPLATGPGELPQLTAVSATATRMHTRDNKEGNREINFFTILLRQWRETAAWCDGARPDIVGLAPPPT